MSLFVEIFGVPWRLEGSIRDEDHLSIVTSQPFVKGDAAEVEEIHAMMESLGFRLAKGVVAGREDSTSYFRTSDRVAVFDAHGENFIRIPADVIPIDALVITANDSLAAFLEMPPAERNRELGLPHR